MRNEGESREGREGDWERKSERGWVGEYWTKRWGRWWMLRRGVLQIPFCSSLNFVTFHSSLFALWIRKLCVCVCFISCTTLAYNLNECLLFFDCDIQLISSHYFRCYCWFIVMIVWNLIIQINGDSHHTHVTIKETYSSPVNGDSEDVRCVGAKIKQFIKALLRYIRIQIISLK